MDRGLLEAARMGDLQRVRSLVEGGADPNGNNNSHDDCSGEGMILIKLKLLFIQKTIR